MACPRDYWCQSIAMSIIVYNGKKFCVVIKHYSLMGTFNVDAKQCLDECYCKSAPSYKYWFAEFRRNCIRIKDAPRSERTPDTCTS